MENHTALPGNRKLCVKFLIVEEALNIVDQVLLHGGWKDHVAPGRTGHRLPKLFGLIPVAIVEDEDLVVQL